LNLSSRDRKESRSFSLGTKPEPERSCSDSTKLKSPRRILNEEGGTEVLIVCNWERRCLLL